MPATPVLPRQLDAGWSREELEASWRALSAENTELHALGAQYSTRRELTARGVILQMQAALTKARLTGDPRAQEEAEERMAEFMRTPTVAHPSQVRWSVGLGLRYGASGTPIRCAVLLDSDFASDATLAISGDFADEAAQLRYAQRLADSLNPPTASEG